MKLSKITIKNILSYIEGQSKWLASKFIDLPQHTKEQILYRLDKCKNTCVKEGECRFCGCPPNKKAFVVKSCNEGKIFPDLMNEDEWEKFKKKNDI